MTSRDYIKIAAAVRAQMEFEDGFYESTNALVSLSERLADMLAADNPRFDRARFLAACGVTV